MNGEPPRLVTALLFLLVVSSGKQAVAATVDTLSELMRSVVHLGLMLR
jgi:hypothetical protein